MLLIFRKLQLPWANMSFAATVYNDPKSNDSGIREMSAFLTAL